MKKMFSPLLTGILLAVMVLANTIAYIALIHFLKLPYWTLIVVAVFTVVALATVMYIVLQRIKELREGYEDDLSNY